MFQGKQDSSTTINDSNSIPDAGRAKQDFEFIEGTTNVVLIAPHGGPGKDNDRYTAQLTRELAKRLGCFAAINAIYDKAKMIIFVADFLCFFYCGPDAAF